MALGWLARPATAVRVHACHAMAHAHVDAKTHVGHAHVDERTHAGGRNSAHVGGRARAHVVYVVHRDAADARDRPAMCLLAAAAATDGAACSWGPAAQAAGAEVRAALGHSYTRYTQ